MSSLVKTQFTTSAPKFKLTVSLPRMENEKANDGQNLPGKSIFLKFICTYVNYSNFYSLLLCNVVSRNYKGIFRLMLSSIISFLIFCLALTFMNILQTL